jgi:hypothetical protein
MKQNPETVCDELTCISMGIMQMISSEMVQVIEECPGSVIDTFEKNPGAVIALFGHDLGQKLLKMEKTLRLVCDASVEADDAEI